MSSWVTMIVLALFAVYGFVRLYNCLVSHGLCIKFSARKVFVCAFFGFALLLAALASVVMRFDSIKHCLLDLLPADFVLSVRVALKGVCGTDSVFSVLQSACACCFLVFSVITCIGGLFIVKHFPIVVVLHVTAYIRRVYTSFKRVVSAYVRPFFQTAARYNS